MPWIIDYPLVLDQMRSQKLKCFYHNSGAFGFGESVTTHVVGWIGPADPTIRPEMLDRARSIAEPYEATLAELALRAWREVLPGRAWVMPASHWAYELEFGSREWMPPLLERIGVDPGLLARRNTAAAIEFSPDEAEPFAHLTHRLLEMLHGSDFTVVFPHRPALCRLHHHKQLWWTSSDATLAGRLRELPDDRPTS